MARTSRKQGMAALQAENPVMKIALYVRLSHEDNGGRSMDGIDNQLELLMNFTRQLENEETFFKSSSKASGRKIEIIETYMDNGQTGTDFARPGWERMMEDAKRHRINCIIVKDLSRFARNYLEAGDYLEKIFPFLGVRFIAVNDHFDSAGEIFQKKELITEFKNLANDYYSKDISKKIMSAFQTKREQGKFIGNKAPYGYLLKNNHFVVDEPAAEIVRRIFIMKMQGMSAYQIANILNQEGIPSPSRYAREQGMKKYKDCGHVLWQQEAVSRILYNRTYVGDLIQGKYNHSIYSKERRGKRAEDEWEVLEGIHSAIIDREVFLKVQEIKEKNRKIWQNRQGGSAYGHSQIKCNASSIVDYKIFDMVLKQIKLQIDLAVEVSRLIEQIKESDIYSVVHQKKKKEVKQTKDKLRRYVYLKMIIYEEMKLGVLTREEFLSTKERYMLKISELEMELNEKEKDLKDFEQCISGENQWVKTFLDFQDTKELTREIAVKLLEKVEVYEDKRIHIKFRFRNEYEYSI